MSLRDILDVSEPSGTWPSENLPRSNDDRQVIPVLSRYERELWFLTFAAMLVDVTLTVHGLQLGLRELNPVARAAIDSIGVLGLYGLKGIALVLGVICVSMIPDRYTPLVPLGLVVPSLVAVVINTAVITAVVT